MAADSRRAIWQSESHVSRKWTEKDGLFSQDMLTIVGFTELITINCVKVLDLTGT